MTLNLSLAVLIPLNLSGMLYPKYISQVCTLKLAVEHVNTRNASIVPELANLRPGFSMSYTLLDRQFNAPDAVDALMKRGKALEQLKVRQTVWSCDARVMGCDFQTLSLC